MAKLTLSKIAVVLIVSFCWTVPGWAENSVVIESKAVAPGATSVTLGVYITNDVSLSGIVLPLEFRQLTAGAYVTNSMTLTLNPGARIASSGLTDLIVHNYHPTPDVNTCSGPISHTFGAAGSIDFVSPDGVVWSGVSFLSPALPAGSDGSPSGGVPSFLLTFDVTNTDGIFEIDSCCIASSNHLIFVKAGFGTGIVPSFTKSVITIGSGSCCVDPNRGDVNGDGGDTLDIADLVYLIAFMFQGGPPPPCDLEGNIDGSDGIDMSDLVVLIDYMFRGGVPPADCP